MAADGSTKAIFAAMFANFGIAIAKFVAFVVTGASSMLAESIHSVADTSNQGLLLLGSRRARREATPEHPFGYGRERYFWSFVVALVLFSVGGLFALYEGYQKLRDPHELESPLWAIGVLVVGIALEAYSFRTAIVAADRVREGRSWMEFIRHAKAPELPVVLLEDLGAQVGLILALIGVGLTVLTGNGVFDALGTMSIGALLVVIAILLAVEMKSLLIGESATPEDREQIVTTIRSSEYVRRLIHLRTQHLGPEELLVGCKVELDGDLSFREVSDAIDVIERRLREAVPAARVVYVEPDTFERSEAQ